MPDRSRRQFLELGAAAALAVNGQAAVDAVPMIQAPFSPANPRIGLIGTGGRGNSLLKNLLAANVKIPALCDLVPDKVARATEMVVKAGQSSPAVYPKGEYAFEKSLDRDHLDAAIFATPWNWHTPMAFSAMKKGKHAFTEMPAVTTIDECWNLVNTSAQTRKHSVMLENCCYRYNETLVPAMTRAGLFANLLYGEAAYIHDLREELFGDKGEGLWRRSFHTKRDGNLHPTHGLGRVANYKGINRGDRFDYLVSMSMPALGLAAYRAQNVPRDNPKWNERYLNGDMNTSLIKTANGLTINLQHDVSNPRPYDCLNSVAGTKGVFKDYRPRLYLDGQAGGSAPVEFPDFTRGRWKERKGCAI